MKTLLIIGYVWPEPNSSAAGARMLQLIRCFQADNYHITYASPAAPSEHAIDYTAFNITTKSIELNSASFDNFITELNPLAVMFDRFMMEEQFAWRVEKFVPNAIRLLDTEDLHCLRHARQALAKQNKEAIFQNVTPTDLASDLAKREIAAILRCDLTYMISEHEINILKDLFHVPEHILSYVPFLLNEKQLDESQLSYQLNFEQRQHFVSIGNFRHEPNWDAVLTLKQYIWPLIRKQLPNAQLHVYGAYPPKKATQLHNEKQGFFVKGWCEDAFEVLKNAKVLLAPLRFGAGLKGKMVDAARCGLPAITTSIGAEGLYKEQKNTGELETCISTDNFTEFAQQAAELYQNKILWNKIQKNGAPWLTMRFSENHYQAKMLNQLNTAIEHLNKHRLKNFTGAMLRHHSMKSTQYMSQWIEAKNRIEG